MNSDLEVLEKKLTSLISLCNDLHSENQQLRLDLSATQHDANTLKAQIAEASTRIEALMESLP